MAIDSQGNALVVWTRPDRFHHHRVQLRRRSVSGNLSSIQTLSGAHRDAWQPQVAVDDNDNALVVWTRFDGNTNRVQLRRRSAAGTLGPVQTLSAPGTDAHDAQIAIDAHGNALVVWTGQEELAGTYRILARRRSASGTLGPIERLSPETGSADEPQLAIDSSGNALVVWKRNSRIQLRSVSKSGALGAVKTLSAAPAFTPQLAIDANRNALVVWSGVGGIQVRRRSASGGLSAVQTLSAAGGDGGLPQVAINANGAGLVVWQRYDYDSGKWSIQLRRRSTSGGLSAVRTLSGSGRSDAFRPQLAIDVRNNAFVVWQRTDGTDYSIQLRRRTAWGNLGPIQNLSVPGARASDPPVAIDAGLIALAVWSHFDGTHWRIEAAQRAP